MLSALAGRITDLLIRAAETALGFLDEPGTELKADHTLVTKADHAVEAFLLRELERESAEIRVIGEETAESKSPEYLRAALSGPATFVVDPIDGTSMFAHRIPVWGILIGYAEHGMLLEGGTILPGTGELMVSDRGKTWYLQSSLPLRDWTPETMLRELVPPSDSFDGRSLLAFSQRSVRAGVRLRTPNPVAAFGSTSCLGVLLATGRVFGAFHDAKLWDYAGILPSLRNLGFAGVSLRGTGNIMNGSIGPDNFCLPDAGPEKAFRVHSDILFAPSVKAAERFRSVLDLPAGF